jgi:hypothetical protein
MVVRKLSALLMSQEKFLNGHGNGCCNTASDGNTGTPLLDGVKKIAALFSKSGARLPSPPVDTSDWKDEDWERALEKANGKSTETKQEPLTSSPPEGMTQEEALSWLKTLFPPTK